jgi:hypothetical protein
MRIVTDKVEAVIGLHRCGDVVRRFVEFFSIWRDSFSLTIPRIEYSRGLVSFDFTQMPQLSINLDSGYPGLQCFWSLLLGCLGLVTRRGGLLRS